MLSPTLLTVKTNSSQIWLSPIKKSRKEKMMEMAEHLLEIYKNNSGAKRKEIDKLLKDYPLHSKNRKYFTALCHLLEKKSEYGIADKDLEKIEFIKDSGDIQKCAEFRLKLFKYAHAQKVIPNQLDHILERFVEEEKWGLSSGNPILEEFLYADLKENWRLLKFFACSAEHLFEEYEIGRVQAILLRSKNLKVTFDLPDTADLRYIFRQLKFRELLFSMRQFDENTCQRLEVLLDGPFSLFDARTKYGLRLAVSLPLFLSAENLQIEADIEWKKGQRAKTFSWSPEELCAGSRYTEKQKEKVQISKNVESLYKNLKKIAALNKDKIKISLNQKVLFQAGFSVVIPEISLQKEGISSVYLEFFSATSRTTIIKRIEMIEEGFKEKLILLYPVKCRISEEMLDQKYGSALYSYKRTLNAESIFEKFLNLNPIVKVC